MLSRLRDEAEFVCLLMNAYSLSIVQLLLCFCSKLKTLGIMVGDNSQLLYELRTDWHFV